MGSTCTGFWRMNRSFPGRTEEKSGKQTKEVESPEADPKRARSRRQQSTAGLEVHFSNWNMCASHLGVLLNCQHRGPGWG